MDREKPQRGVARHPACREIRARERRRGRIGGGATQDRRVRSGISHLALADRVALTPPQDSTLITTASGKRHASDAADWKWWHHSVPGRLRELYNKEG